MTRTIFGLILVSVCLSAIAQITLKTGMSDRRVLAAMDAGQWLPTLQTIAVHPAILAGLALYGLGAVVWLFVLGRIDVSQAYPFVGLGFLVTMVLGCVVLHEQPGLYRIAGTLLVAVGVWLVSLA